MIIINRLHTLPAFNNEPFCCVVNSGVYIDKKNELVVPQYTDTKQLSDSALLLIRYLIRYKNTDISMSEAELAFGVLVEKHIYSTENLKQESNKLKEKAPAKSNGERHTSFSELYHSLLEQNNGVENEETVQLVRTFAARNLIRIAFENGLINDFTPNNKEKSEYEYLCFIWSNLTELQKQGLVVRFYPISGEYSDIGKETNFHMPERNICLVLPKVEEYEQNAKFITYLYESISPVEANAIGYRNFREEYASKPFPFSTIRFTSAGISLTEDCQYKCEYCSFDSGCGGKTLDFATIKAFVDYLVKNAVINGLVTDKEPSISVIIAGGGEPTLHRELFTDSVNYIKQKCRENNVKSRLEITTNGCHTPEQTLFIAENFDDITISFDGLPELQNKNRHFANGSPTFEVVDRTLKQLDDMQATYSVLSVVCPEDYSSLTSIVSFVLSRYPHIRNLSVRPTMSSGRAIKKQINSNIFDYSFASAYFEMQKALDYPQKVSCGLFNERYIGNFCGALYGGHPWLVPNKKIVTCQDAREKAVVIGEICDNSVDIFEVEDIYAEKNALNLSECDGCSLYCHCKGGCPLAKNSTEAEKFRLFSCREAKKFQSLKLTHLIEHRSFGNLYLQEYTQTDFPKHLAYTVKKR